jgi:hypothetical protein
MKSINRRTFLEFLGVGAVSTLLPAPRLYATPPFRKSPIQNLTLKGILPSSEDQVILAEGFSWELLIKWTDKISDKDSFGFNNDYLAFMPLDGNPNDGLLWVNHEYVDPMFISGYTGEKEKKKEQVVKEMYNVGGSILRIRKDKIGWKVVKNDPYNRRLTAETEIPFNWPEPISGKTSGIGTLANCAGGVTPWGAVLTCEENYDLFWGERDHTTGERKPSEYGWEKFFDYPPEHYGWVVEVNPLTGEAQKHIALGRCAHECATVVELPDGRIVVYSGDDGNNQCLYKFISSEPRSLLNGTLYVANTLMGRWIPVSYAEQPNLQAKFKDQTEVLIRLREAVRYIGGSPLDRPEDIEIDPENGNVLVSLTNNLAKSDKNYHGSILKIMETDGRHDSLTFRSEAFLTGGLETGFACPDNLAFDRNGNLWFTSDISAAATSLPEYLPFKNNGLFVVPRQGEQAGQVVQVASAPVGAEFTGPFFSPDGQTLFLSVQHPGEYSPDMKNLTSHWPDGGNSMPRPGVIAISGAFLQ